MTISIRNKYKDYINGGKSFELVSHVICFTVGRLSFYLTPEPDNRLSIGTMNSPGIEKMTFNPIWPKLTPKEKKLIFTLLILYGFEINDLNLLPFVSLISIAYVLDKLREGEEGYYLVNKIMCLILDNEISILEDSNYKGRYHE